MSSTSPTRRMERRRANPPPAAGPSFEVAQGRTGKILSGLALLFAVIGIPVAVYLTVQHYEGIAPICSTHGDWFSSLISTLGASVNCGAVTSSAYSTAGPTTVPITVPGLLWFIVSGTLAAWALLAAAGKLTAPPWLYNAHMVWALFGLGFVIYLVYIEFGVLHQVCEWCSGVHFLTLLTFIVVLVQWQRLARSRYQPAD